jgi:peptidoglycan-associated lipoprotein
MVARGARIMSRQAKVALAVLAFPWGLCLALGLGACRKQVMSDAPRAEISSPRRKGPIGNEPRVVVSGRNDRPGGSVGLGLLPVFFAYDKYNLSKTARRDMQSNTEYLLARPEQTFTVSGHTDERGTAEYNLALGQKRAQVVVDYYRALGVYNLKAVSYGEERPACLQHTENCWVFNRRAEVTR